MAKSLGGIALPDGTGDLGDIEWTDRYNSQSVSQSAKRTLAGNIVVDSRFLSSGRHITLVAADTVCWLMLATVDAIKVLADQAATSYTLVWNGEIYTVVFRHHEPPAFSVEPIYPHNSRFFATIRLMTI